MNHNRMAGSLTGLCILTLSCMLVAPTWAEAGPITVSTSGTFQLWQGPLELVGVNNAELPVIPDAPFLVGYVPSGDLPGPKGAAGFEFRFRFDEGLPDIVARGTIDWLGYNFWEPVANAAISTTATPEQIASYPSLFQNLIANPHWLHTTSFDGGASSFAISMEVHPVDPNVLRPIPEPASVATFAGLLAVLGLRARRRSR